MLRVSNKEQRSMQAVRHFRLRREQKRRNFHWFGLSARCIGFWRRD